MEKAKFDINPHVIRQLGAELVSDQVTALMELKKIHMMLMQVMLK